MIKNLVKHGNSWALVIDDSMLELLKIDPEQPLELSTDGHAMTITPAALSQHSEKVLAARKEVNDRYKNVFKKLAE